jgi:hypothetical protein
MTTLRNAIIAAGVCGLAAAGTDQACAQLRLPPARALCSVLSGHPCHPSFCGVFHRGPCFPQYLPPIGEDLQVTIVSTDANKRGSDAEKDNTTTGANNARKHDSDVEKDNAQSAGATTAADESAVDSIAAMFATLRTCWLPPPKDKSRRGMEYTVRFAFKQDGEILAPPRRTYSSHDASADVRDIYRDAINAALARCTPLHFSKEMAEAVAGRPIAIRFVDNRTIESKKTSQ